MALLRGGQEAVTAKPTVAELGIDPAAEAWHRSGHGDGAIEIAFVSGTRGSVPPDRAEWVLMRVAGDPSSEFLSSTGTSGNASSTGRGTASSMTLCSPAHHHP